MISSIFNKIISLIWRRKYTPREENEKNWIYHEDKVKIRVLNSSSETLEQSRMQRKGAVYSEVILPDGVDEKFRDPEILFGPDLNTPLNIRHYDYLKVFNDGGFPLCVGPDQIEFIKRTRAIYCDDQKCWFWPYENHLYVDEMQQVLPRIHNPLCNHFDCESGFCIRPPLVPNLVPEPLWEKNLRKYLSKKNWDFISKYTCSQSGYRCSICGGRGEEWPVECHEVWDYRTLEDGNGIAVLIELRALCPRCHQVNHLGKANIDGKYNETIRHMAYINSWSLNHSECVAEEAFKLFYERSEKSWLIGYDDECAWEPSVEKILKTFFCEALLKNATRF